MHPVDHYHHLTGKPCNCAWGVKPLHIKTAAQQSWEDMKNFKKFQNPEAQELLKKFEEDGYVNDRSEKWMPWLLNQFKKGHLERDPVVDRIIQHVPGGFGGLRPSQWHHWADWLNSGHPTRQAFNPEKHELPELLQGVGTWDKDMEERATEVAAKKARGDGEVVHTSPDNWTVRKMRDRDEMKREGDSMGHCFGSYGDECENGENLYYSLRDPKGDPHISFAVDPLYAEQNGERVQRQHAETDAPPIPHGGKAYNLYGKGNEDPKPEYKRQLRSWFDSFKEPYLLEKGGSDDYDDERIFTASDLDEDWAKIPDGRGKDEYGLLAHPKEVDYDSVLNTMADDRYGLWDGNHPELLYQHAKARGEIPELAEAAGKFSEEATDSFHQWRMENADHTLPYPMDDDYPDTPEGKEKYDEDLKAYEEEESEWVAEHPGMAITNEMYGHLNKHFDPKTNRYVNQPPTQAFSKIAHRPLYYRFAFDPQSGEVELAHNRETHPAYIRHHGDLAGNGGMVHGYAYRIGNGWRLTDYDDKPFNDNYIRTKVVRAVRKKEGLKEDNKPHVGGAAWPDLQPDFTRFHYGLPV